MKSLKEQWTEASVEVYKKMSMIEALKGYKVREDLMACEVKKLKMLQQKRDSLGAALERVASTQRNFYWSPTK